MPIKAPRAKPRKRKPPKDDQQAQYDDLEREISDIVRDARIRLRRLARSERYVPEVRGSVWFRVATEFTQVALGEMAPQPIDFGPGGDPSGRRAASSIVAATFSELLICIMEDFADAKGVAPEDLSKDQREDLITWLVTALGSGHDAAFTIVADLYGHLGLRERILSDLKPVA